MFITDIKEQLCNAYELFSAENGTLFPLISLLASALLPSSCILQQLKVIKEKEQKCSLITIPSNILFDDTVKPYDTIKYHSVA